jgi:exo-beta-1,3-glucanase (GH17 family)
MDNHKLGRLNRLLILAALSAVVITIFSLGCGKSTDGSAKANTEKTKDVTAAQIFGNPAYRAISYGGYRVNNRDVQPTVAELKEDMLLLQAMDIKLLRTYNTHLAQASNILAAIHELKTEDPNFEMYVMLGAWMDCKGAFTANPDHNVEDTTANAAEIERAVKMAKQYPDIVKVIAVGNEAMVKWAASYFVQPGVILRWVNHLQSLKAKGELPESLWITSSDNFASWGGGGGEYHVPDLEKLVQAVDYISLHTYPMHDTHYNPEFWGVTAAQAKLSKEQQSKAAMDRAVQYAQMQYQQVTDYIRGLGATGKPIHIGETGWATSSNGFFSPKGSKASDEYKSALYHQGIREWTDQAGISCFYFEAFDENWKDAQNPGGSENHFGLFTIDGKAKYAIWDLVDNGAFEGLGRNGQPVTKTYDGDKAALLETLAAPPMMAEEPAQ